MRVRSLLQRIGGSSSSSSSGSPLAPFLSSSDVVIVREDGVLRGADLAALVRHDATALVVRRFVPPAAAAAIGEELAAEVARGRARNWRVGVGDGRRGLESSDVATLGEHPPYNVAAATDDEDAYFEGVRRELEARRRGIDDAPRLWPTDALRLRLDEAWPGGAGLAREPDRERRVFGGGLPRVAIGPTRWSRGFVHADDPRPLDDARGTFAANVYLRLPEPDNDDEEEHLHVWPLKIRSRWDWYKNAPLLSALASQDPEDQARLREALGAPHAIAVEPGDLVLLCVQRPHAAVGFRRGVRVSLQCFLRHEGENERLLVDC